MKVFRWGAFKAKVMTELTDTYPELDKKYLPAMLINIKSLNRRPLKWKLNDLAKWL